MNRLPRVVLDNIHSGLSAPGLDAGYLLYQIGQVVNVEFEQTKMR